VSWEWLVLGAILLVAVLPLIKWLRRLVWAFALAFGMMLILHMQTNPAEATAALGALGGGLMLARPVRRMVLGGLV
jgi:hypothetical protein